MSTTSYRALHYVLKIGNRKEAIEFLRCGLGMKVLRHEEFEKGCEATCNGPYDGKWSKTMIGYGPEDDHFVLELTYNYGISTYRHGNALFSIQILKKDVSGLVNLGAKLEKQKKSKDSSETTDVYVIYNNGYRFEIMQSPNEDQISQVTIACAAFETSLPDIAEDFYVKLLGMKKVGTDNDGKQYSFAPNQAILCLKSLEKNAKVDHGTAFGRFAFACPTENLPKIQENVSKDVEEKGKILTSLISLDTPGKATVSVVIVADPLGHEICFVGDEGFRDLSKVDPTSDAELTKKIAEDKSDEWFAKHGKSKEVSK